MAVYVGNLHEMPVIILKVCITGMNSLPVKHVDAADSTMRELIGASFYGIGTC